ncbi:kinase-like protein [Wolfiporia cocos MD-104 SS10]|uniref:Kinase-like protein n=1 Tax=Wolfiporia cocos (strain MD-104) TaxID=742152 RepID=A0A2H3J2M4_WOLCO|nr:kinase-like protein [Wolfiporia cocos MD-104 SS10]
MELGSGTYTITNVRWGNRAYLPNARRGQDVLGAVPSAEFAPSEAEIWEIRRAGELFTVKNLRADQYASTARAATSGAPIRSDQLETYWRIVDVGTLSDGSSAYRIIHPDQDVSWTLDDIEDNTPIELQRTSPSNLRSQWKIIGYPGDAQPGALSAHGLTVPILESQAAPPLPAGQLPSTGHIDHVSLLISNVRLQMPQQYPDLQIEVNAQDQCVKAAISSAGGTLASCNHAVYLRVVNVASGLDIALHTSQHSENESMIVAKGHISDTEIIGPKGNIELALNLHGTSEGDTIPISCSFEYLKCGDPDAYHTIEKIMQDIESYSSTVGREAYEVIWDMLSSNDSIEILKRIRTDSAQGFIDNLDIAISKLEREDDRYQRGFYLLQKLCSQHRVLPQSYYLDAGEVKRESHHFANGRFGAVYRGTYKGKVVAIKMMNLAIGEKAAELDVESIQEAILWKHSQHPRILPLTGVYRDDHLYCLVSPFMKRGDLWHYVNSVDDIDRIALVRDIVEGLDYLHRQDVVHGDLSALNVLIDDDGHACLGDFGVSRKKLSYSYATVSVSATAKTLQYTAPERIDPEGYGLSHERLTKESDVYALSILMWEIYAGARTKPYPSCSNDAMLIHGVLQGVRPQRIAGIPDDIWALMARCWGPDYTKRPSIHEVQSVVLSIWTV